MLKIYKSVTVWCLIFFSIPSIAEGIIDIKPYVGTSIDYDDNVFRFSSPEQAKAAFGSSTTSDTVKRVDLGVDINLRLSRQLLTLSSNINDSRYNRFEILDNTGKSNRLSWSWRLGNDVYGELTASKSEAIAGFNEIKQPVNNLRTSSHQIASINWNLHPDWTLSTSYEKAKTENNLSNFKALDREDDIYESGVRYLNQRGTQVGLSYRVADSNFPSRTGFTQLFFGDESTQKEIITNVVWLPTSKTRISARISQVSLSHPGLSTRDFNGLSQRWNIDHSLTGQVNLNLSVYQEVNPVDDVISTYVKTKGFSVNPNWIVTSKISLRGGLGYEERNYLGSAGILFNNADRYDESKLANLSLTYTPTRKSLIQLQYQGERRSSNIDNSGYQFNNLNFLLRYDF